MKAKELYARLEKDFIRPELSDDWAEYMNEVKDFLSDNFKKRSMGLVCDNSEQINKVYTAVFPTKEVMKYVLNQKAENAMLFVHHPSIWDITNTPEVFQQMDKGLLKKFKARRISVYNLHVPLDNYGEYSTSLTLAKGLGINPTKPFGQYFGALCGIFGKTKLKTTRELSNNFKKLVGHKVSLYQYGSPEIKRGVIAVVAGGGNDVEMLQEVAKEGINTFVTGITALSPHSQKAHEFAKKNKINILGGTHYSTERFACISMCNYFRKLGLESQFIEGKPGLEDL
ncbi:NIF3 (NGG1p interacting factor 3) [uncultured archaeon]|nr:NIF3 (NGG1p interacting factor 3) [uncultured archaeon]